MSHLSILICLVVLSILNIILFIHFKKEQTKLDNNENETAKNDISADEIAIEQWQEVFKKIEKKSVYFKATSKNSFNKIGGKPNLPNELKWPTLNGTPLSFIAQIDLSTLPKNNAIIPNETSGALFVFGILIDGCYFGDEEDGQKAYRVLYSKNTTAPECEFPKNLDIDARYEPQYLQSSKIVYDLPVSIEDNFKDFNISLASFDNYIEALEMKKAEDSNLLNLHEKACIKFGGYEEFMQGRILKIVNNGNTNEENKNTIKINNLINIAEDEQSVFLCQIKSQCDKGENMYIGDGGIIYIYIKKEDLMLGNFKNFYVAMQCG
ncbi:MAG: DUF1963 domain-containing protein [Clostridia bacterium]|nr:DUF1963 domain-containing protein [Clostridia bacterium]